jgi:hypothetical protein
MKAVLKSGIEFPQDALIVGNSLHIDDRLNPHPANVENMVSF